MAAHDNLGLETALKRLIRCLSGGGGKMAPEEEPHIDWQGTRIGY